MDSLLTQFRGSDYMLNENENVMGRLEWLNHLSLIFNLTANVPLISPSSASVTTEAFLNSLIENFSSLPLHPPKVYSKFNSVKSISFKEIFMIFEKDFGRVLNWDQILEKVVNFEVNQIGHHRKASPGSIDLNELVFISKVAGSSECEEAEHRGKLSDLRIPNLEGSRECDKALRVPETGYIPASLGKKK